VIFTIVPPSRGIGGISLNYMLQIALERPLMPTHRFGFDSGTNRFLNVVFDS
jgi:hypothetical protein